MGFKVLYHLTTNNLKGIAEEAKWAEAMGYDGLCTEDAAHDPMLPLLMAASTTSRVTLETRVTIAFPRSPWCWLTRPETSRTFPVGGSVWAWVPK